MLATTILTQRGHMFAWVPVCMAIGIGGYFSLRFEPSTALLFGAGGLALACLLIGWRISEVFGPFLIAIALILGGFVLAASRAHSLDHPVLSWRYYGPIEGRIVGMDRSGSDAVRLTLDQVRLDRVAPNRTPTRVRISLHGDSALGIDPKPGLRVMTTGHLSPPSGPVEPGGFDFQRHAWFAELGGVGYTRVPLLAIALSKNDWSQRIFRIRMDVSAHVRHLLPGDVGGFAAAVTTGDRSGLSKDALLDLRASNTAHLIAISGLHMGLLTGFVFALLRLILIILPYVGQRMPVRKVAAGGALISAAVYLALSGGNVSTERAFVMVAVMLCAVMLDRRAISLRAVAIAAIVVLILRPEALLGPGFQMSFAATAALVAVFEWIRDNQIKLGPKWAQPVVAVVISSAVAGLATGPIGAAHFNTVAHYGLLANLLSVPLMGFLVIPAAVLALILAPFGLEAVGLWLMGLGLRWILGVADYVAAMDGARGYVMGPGAIVLPMLALGALWVILWQGRSRVIGVIPMIAAFVLWGQGERPVALVSDSASIIGVMTTDGRALSKPKGAGFVASNWLENDGDPAAQDTAALRWGASPDRLKSKQIGDVELMHVIGKKAVADLRACRAGQVIVASVTPEQAITGCTVIHPMTLRDTGAVAFYEKGGKVTMHTARDASGDRLWSGWK
ncbi:ComEC/Rec2 family competence protein [Pseudosulfitobacter sp. SM2401]|uniref:ComEC/Rec2 family competence protein n=1 Tax=Pseudosulfitobacter sp. SM2401 TaxID=3350098 RepID=UPI0036F39C58